MLQTILSRCDERYRNHQDHCSECSYGEFCPHDCERCLDFIHNPGHAPSGAPDRKYDCTNMADMYTCKYSCRYTSELIYALRRFADLKNQEQIRVLSFGCGPCTDLFALDYLKQHNEMCFQSIEYRGIDYSREVWRPIHNDILSFEDERRRINFYYADMCDIIHEIARGRWTPNLIVFQYVFSDMHKHTQENEIANFIEVFAQYYNEKVLPGSYTVLNDVNLSKSYNGGREYFDQLFSHLVSSSMRKGRFCNDNAKSQFYPRGYTYGNDSDDEFASNRNLFDLQPWQRYSPFNTCASAQMLIKKEAGV